MKSAGLEPALLELVRVRASQINGCAYCLDMHGKDARAAGAAVPLLREEPAVHCEHVTGHERGGGGGEPHDRRRHLFRLAEPA